MTFDAALAILEDIRQSQGYLSPADVATAMEIAMASRGVDDCEIGRRVGSWYGYLYKGRERLFTILLESP